MRTCTVFAIFWLAVGITPSFAGERHGAHGWTDPLEKPYPQDPQRTYPFEKEKNHPGDPQRRPSSQGDWVVFPGAILHKALVASPVASPTLEEKDKQLPRVSRVVSIER
ncbi:hypothetical protein F5148DRAFT_1203134 [Russula earlei]|uniref:Uncharacterized protein n=1 Tax=Russula earlei TaxID=71964 RepID=A0ACC0U827_9AGAM|nr:hypothetical protein F5148DRAFT_1203134 [Russula earlei]